MNWDRIEGSWKQLKGKARMEWGKLADDQLDVIAGKRDQLVGRVQEQYGIGKDEAEKQVDRFAASFRRGRQVVKGRSRTVRKLSLTLVTVAGLALSATAFPGCAPARAKESTGEYLDNTVITAKVKAAILEDPSLKSLQISVKTYKDVVQLSGFVDSARSAQQAGDVASRVPGVSSVKNDLIVK